eukprot:scaffold47195_cov48-Phaeocystis_antarctica.AAC.2
MHRHPAAPRTRGSGYLVRVRARARARARVRARVRARARARAKVRVRRGSGCLRRRRSVAPPARRAGQPVQGEAHMCE